MSKMIGRLVCLGLLSIASPARADLATPAPEASSPVAATGTAEPAATISRAAVTPHANPRLKLSFRSFSISNLDLTPVWLDGAQLDVYPLSRRYIRAGFEFEGGAGHATLDGQGANLSYGLAGVTAGFQYPARVTPFIEARVAGGLIAGSMSYAMSGVTGSFSGVTYGWLGGIDGGIELYTAGRLYISAAIGWARPTWHGLDYSAMKADPTGGMRFKDLTNDTFTFKVGIGI